MVNTTVVMMLFKIITMMESMNDWGDVEFVPKAGYISLMHGSTTVAYFNFRKKDVKIELVRGIEKLDGTLSKNFFSLNDPEGIASSRSWTWKSGAKGRIYQIAMAGNSDIDYLHFLIKQKYNALSLG